MAINEKNTKNLKISNMALRAYRTLDVRPILYYASSEVLPSSGGT